MTAPDPAPSEFMRAALEEAEAALGTTSPNPAVGAVLVRDGRIVGRGRTQPPSGPHAEVMALREAGDAARGATLYVTLEPHNHQGRTPPCTEALIEAGVAIVHYAIDDPNPLVAGSGAQRLREAGIEVTSGDGAAEAERVMEGYLHHRATGRPLVIVKYAASMDGRIASASGNARWVSGPEARAWLHVLRTKIDAVMVGSTTALVDDPELTARPEDIEDPHQPYRIVVDSQGRLSSGARVLGPGAIIATTDASPAEWREAIAATGAEVLVLPADESYVSLPALLDALGERGVLTLLVEGGGALLGALFDQRLVDRLYAVIAPVIIGAADAPSAVSGQGAHVMADAPRLRDSTVERLGEDTLISGVPVWPDATNAEGPARE
ncbi:MAG: bifunctional diaminohydroxyphosphoribosylaminopyrimidine deaminase/5-amino-6-(5-phosphoribosylamino)uracil reductase RibD [Dehalococcoidia bacterium]|nr:bifunctional diaminohydroxyphosphoribosylaminopyrimidine deaminase/5-amino-6-(5-phosphoribosylamino)uracil reductase RibD [Dehalococcoidia bacterium]